MKKIIAIITVVLMSSFTFSQERVINGKVTDENNVTLPGVSIFVKGTTNGTVSDMDGEYRIEVKKADAVLVFSYLGYKTVESTTAGKKEVNVQMSTDTESLTEIVITGIRASNISEVKAKRDAATVIEAITPEDIGNFSDTNAADALQRVAGVQIERDVDGVSGDRVSIRGIGPQFVGVTMNGRTPISAGNEGKSDFRKFNLNVIPTEIISGARIHKTTQAKEVSTNIGGTVDFQTIRPLDIRYKGGKNYFASINVRGASNSTIEDLDFGHRFSGVYGAKINDKLGVALAVIYADEDNIKDETGVRSVTNLGGLGITLNDDNGNEYDNVTVGRTYNNGLLRTNQVRKAISAAIQWKPIEQLSFVLDYTGTNVEANSDRQVFQVLLGNTNDNQLLGGFHEFEKDSLLFNETNGVNYVNFISPSSNTNSRTTVRNTNQFYDNHSTNNIVGLNTTYQSGKVKFITDVSYSDLDFFQNLTQVRAQFASYDEADLSVDLRGELPVFGLPSDVFDPNEFSIQAIARRLIRTKGYNYATKFDVEYDLDKDKKITFGVRYSNNTIDARETSTGDAATAFNNAEDAANADADFNELIAEGNRVGVGFNGGNVGGLEQGWLWVPGKVALGFVEGLSGIDGGSVFDFDVDLKDVEGDEGNLGLNARKSYKIEETSTDFYTQLDLKTDLFDIPTAFNFGVRAVRTDNFAAGFSEAVYFDAQDGQDDELSGADLRDFNNQFSLPSEYYEIETSRWDVLPSFNVNFSLKKNMKLRLSAAKAVSRPRYVAIIPNNAISLPANLTATQLADLPNSGVRGQIRSGNPDLKPYSAWSYDTTFEFYTKNGGAFIFSAFYKQLENYITRSIEVGEYPGEELLGIALPDHLTGLIFETSKSINITDGDIYGFEVGLNQHLSFLPGFAKDFGIKANYSFVDSEFDENLGNSADGFPGSSKHNANGTLYYERSGFSLRFTAAYRSDYLSNLGTAIPGSTGAVRADEPHYTEGNTTLGFTARKNLLNKKLQISAGVSNLTGEDIRRYQGGDKRNFSAYYSRNPIWKLTMRYKF
ncbi:TonB-dependent receptor [Polaribacter sp. Hel1_85]|uniref:TonB-dependent receptor n=1 Tax=Polaribacter sp. Hel1_85 TaxID=1250005 RepID=UPI00052D3A5D|nr:TonB-dependent receptor [Polaribacter sp. Hel1_85]KGL62218.1 TonB-dependent receptor, plug [Polaribacter sp. Hel1_85]